MLNASLGISLPSDPRPRVSALWRPRGPQLTLDRPQALPQSVPQPPPVAGRIRPSERLIRSGDPGVLEANVSGSVRSGQCGRRVMDCLSLSLFRARQAAQARLLGSGGQNRHFRRAQARSRGWLSENNGTASQAPPRRRAMLHDRMKSKKGAIHEGTRWIHEDIAFIVV